MYGCNRHHRKSQWCMQPFKPPADYGRQKMVVTNWKPLFDKEATQPIGDIALAPSDPTILYVGTGEANISGLCQELNFQINRCRKTFKHWSWKTLAPLHGSLCIHRTHPLYMLPQAEMNGHTIKTAVYIKPQTVAKPGRIFYTKMKKTGCIDLVMDPSDPNTLYASMESYPQKMEWPGTGRRRLGL